MKGFDFCQPTEIRFGWGRLGELGEITSRFGRRCFLVTMPCIEAMAETYERAKTSLRSAGVQVLHFDGVVANPTTDSVNVGTDAAKDYNADVVVGLGGGSSMDTAKAIAIGATHEGRAWEYRLNSGRQIRPQSLPIIAVTTTSGTGSQVTPVAVITDTDSKCKSAIVDRLLCPRVSIVDPELMRTVPSHMTASTGFDAFAHAFESYIHRDASVYTDLLAMEAMRIVHRYLPTAIGDGLDREARTQLAWADTLAGICISNAGTTLPHGIGMAIGGHAPHVAHGEALAAVYPEFARYTCMHAVDKFAAVGRLLEPTLRSESDSVAASESCEAIDEFLRAIGMALSLEGLGVAESELPAIADDSIKLPDYTVNPRVATRDEILEMLVRGYSRQ